MVESAEDWDSKGQGFNFLSAPYHQYNPHPVTSSLCASLSWPSQQRIPKVSFNCVSPWFLYDVSVLPCSIFSVPMRCCNVNKHQCPCSVSANIIPQWRLNKFTSEQDCILVFSDNHKPWAKLHFVLLLQKLWTSLAWPSSKELPSHSNLLERLLAALKQKNFVNKSQLWDIMQEGKPQDSELNRQCLK